MDHPRQPLWKRNLPGAVVAALIIAGLLGFGIWKYSQPDTEQIGEHVRTAMQAELARDENFSSYQLQVEKVTLIHSSGNDYAGVADVRSAKGSTGQVAVKVVADNKNVIWSTQPGAFAFLAQESAPSFAGWGS